MHRLGWWIALSIAGAALAEPILPRSDDEVVERLPPVVRSAAQPGAIDPDTAVAEARQWLDIARRDGDPRPAGRALARLAPWQNDARAPADLVVMLATLEQYLHRFEAAVRRLQALAAREAAAGRSGSASMAQAWLLLASLHRLQGRLAESDQACAQLQRQRVQPYADACFAENQALRGEFDAARSTFNGLLARNAQPGMRSWLLTSLAEMAQREGDHAAADAAFRQALQAERSGYTAVGYADFLLDQQRPAEAWDALADQPRSDGVLLRLAIAARRMQRPDAAALRDELHARYALADLRPESSGHDRERALMALDIDGKPPLALAAARRNVALQVEPVDLWLLARSARAAGDRGALDQARERARRIGLVDRRIDAL